MQHALQPITPLAIIRVQGAVRSACVSTGTRRVERWSRKISDGLHTPRLLTEQLIDPSLNIAMVVLPSAIEDHCHYCTTITGGCPSLGGCMYLVSASQPSNGPRHTRSLFCHFRHEAMLGDWDRDLFFFFFSSSSLMGAETGTKGHIGHLSQTTARPVKENMDPACGQGCKVATHPPLQFAHTNGPSCCRILSAGRRAHAE